MVNKWDAVEGKETNTMELQRRGYAECFSFMGYAPIIFISAQTGYNVNKLMQLIRDVDAENGTRVKDLTDAEEQKLRDVIDNYIVEGDLRRQTALDIKRLSEIGCYRGMRHRKGLPVRGQRSKTNARTRKGPKKTIANKKK